MSLSEGQRSGAPGNPDACIVGRFSPNRRAATNSARETRPLLRLGLALNLPSRNSCESVGCEELWCLLNSYCTYRSVLLVYLRERESNSRADIRAKNPNGRDPKGGSGV